MNGTASLFVERGPEEVFAYVANLENAPDWVPDLVSVTKTSEGDIGVGTRYTEIVKMGERQNEAELEITEYDAPRVFAHRGKGGPSLFTARFVFTPEGNGTRIEHHYTVKMTGCFVLLAPLTNRWIRKNTEAGMTSLKDALEKGDQETVTE